jgi:hypothetical protein
LTCNICNRKIEEVDKKDRKGKCGCFYHETCISQNYIELLNLGATLFHCPSFKCKTHPRIPLSKDEVIDHYPLIYGDPEKCTCGEEISYDA